MSEPKKATFSVSLNGNFVGTATISVKAGDDIEEAMKSNHDAATLLSIAVVGGECGVPARITTDNLVMFNALAHSPHPTSLTVSFVNGTIEPEVSARYDDEDNDLIDL